MRVRIPLKTLSVPWSPEKGPGCLCLPSLLLEVVSDPRISIPICVILLTEKEEISAWTCHILWPVAHWDARWQQSKWHSFSLRLSDSLRRLRRATLATWNTPTPSLKIRRGLSKLHLIQNWWGRGDRASKETSPLCQAPDGGPSHGNACWRRFADTECCQGKGPLVGLLLPFLTGENRKTLKVGKALKGQVLMEGPDGRSLMKPLREVLILGWWLATDSWHKDFQCNTTTWRCVWSAFLFSKAFTGIRTWLSVGYRFRTRIHLGTKCSRELGLHLGSPNSLYQFALAEAQEMREKRKKKFLFFEPN